MSGIVGAANRENVAADTELVCQMTELLRFRGPDAQVVWSEQQVAFGHALLRLTPDEIDERQPCSLDGKLWITGEVRLDARSALLGRLSNVGVRLSVTASDAHLILAAYQEWGESCLDHLTGDFTFALWDLDRKSLFCARDQFGVRPFFYALLGTALWFSNTLVCLRRHPKLGRTLDECWLGDWLIADMCGDAERTAFTDIKRLPPAHCLRFDKSGLTIRRYWSLPTEHPVLHLNEADYVVEFQRLIQESIADRLPRKSASVFMSGGLDSTLVAGFARQVAEKKFGSADVHAHCMIYESRFADEEKHWAPRAAAGIRIPYHPMALDQYVAFPTWNERQPDSAQKSEVIRQVGMQPEPFNFPAVQSMVDSHRRGAQHSRVALTGHGADPALHWPRDYFNGLLRSGQFFRLIREARAYGRLSGKRPNFGLGWRLFGTNTPADTFPPWLNPHFAARLNLAERWRQLTQPKPSVHRSRPEAYRYLSDHGGWGFLFESMSPGLTGIPLSICHPLFDMRLVTFFLSLPPFPWCVEKEILRRGAVAILPEEIRARPKSLFRGDPNLLAIQQLDHASLPRYTLPVELDPFIQRSAVTSLERLQSDPAIKLPWVHYRPYSLAFWLQQQANSLSIFKG